MGRKRTPQRKPRLIKCVVEHEEYYVNDLMVYYGYEQSRPILYELRKFGLLPYRVHDEWVVWGRNLLEARLNKAKADNNQWPSDGEIDDDEP